MGLAEWAGTAGGVGSSPFWISGRVIMITHPLTILRGRKEPHGTFNTEQAIDPGGGAAAGYVCPGSTDGSSTLDIMYVFIGT
ncbi:unnamed protein product [Merluccius merluccius]